LLNLDTEHQNVNKEYKAP